MRKEADIICLIDLQGFAGSAFEDIGTCLTGKF